MGISARPAVPVLIRMLERPSTSAKMRTACLDALRGIGAKSKPTLRVMRSSLSDENVKVRIHAWQALRAISRESAPSVASTLLPALASDDLDERWYAINATFRLKNREEIDSVIAGLIDCLKDEKSEWGRVHIIRALEEHEKLARVAVPALSAALGDPDLVVRASAARALGRIAAPQEEVLAVLQERSNVDPSWRVRKAASRALVAVERRGS